MAENSTQEQILRRLNLLVLLELDKQAAGPETTLTSKVQKLLRLGLLPAEVASIVNKPVNHITAIVAAGRKAASRRETNGD